MKRSRNVSLAMLGAISISGCNSTELPPPAPHPAPAITGAPLQVGAAPVSESCIVYTQKDACEIKSTTHQCSALPGADGVMSYLPSPCVVGNPAQAAASPINAQPVYHDSSSGMLMGWLLGSMGNRDRTVYVDRSKDNDSSSNGGGSGGSAGYWRGGSSSGGSSENSDAGASHANTSSTSRGGFGFSGRAAGASGSAAS